jgi:hypothetical protein
MKIVFIISILFTGCLFASGSPQNWQLPSNSRTDFILPSPLHDLIEFKTGNGKEAVILAANKNGTVTCRIQDQNGKLHHTLFKINGMAKRNFAWSDNLLGWSNVYEKIFARDPAVFRHKLTFENRDGQTFIFLDGVAVAPFPQMVTTLSSTATIQGFEQANLPVNSPYRQVDISRQCNTKGLAQFSAKEIMVNGVPFRLSSDEYFNHIDLALSWFREGTLSSYEEPQLGSFGGRWSGAAEYNPTRLQFRVPNDEYDSLYLLAGFDARPDHISRLTAQFFRAKAGSPVNFMSGKVPALDMPSNKALIVRDENGKQRYLHCIKIPLSQAQLKSFSDSSVLDFELTKDVQTYVSWPDPFYYSIHGAGLPSGVRVFAATLSKAALTVDFTPDAYANIWTGPAAVSYTVRLANRSDKEISVPVKLSVVSFDRADARDFTQTAIVPGGGNIELKFRFIPKRYGHYNLDLTVGSKSPWRRTLAYLRPRSYEKRPFEAPGHHFGFWSWRGEHRTPHQADAIHLAAPLGMESLSSGVHEWANPETIKMMEQYGIRTNFAFGTSDLWVVSYLAKLSGDDGKDFEKILNDYRKKQEPASSVSEPKFMRIFAEPSGLGTHGILPEFYGEPETVFTPVQQKAFDSHHRRLALAARAVRKITPDIKILMPHGDPVFVIPFLKKNDDVSRSFDGIGIDIGYFERLPEQQMHQCSIHRMYMVRHYWAKFRKEPPLLVTVEGPCISPVRPGALSEREQAAHTMRAALLLAAYDVRHQYSMASLTDSGDYWGEQHYGGGLISAAPLLNPYPSYSATATLIRHMRDLEFIGFEPTGSLSVYCLKFRNLKDNSTVLAMWTIRGTRPVKFTNPVRYYDAMDNASTDDQIIISNLPVFIHQPSSFTLGTPDHSEVKLAEVHLRLGNMANLVKRQSNDAETEYIDMFPEAVRRFPAVMQLTEIKAPAPQGNRALAVTLPEQSVDRGVMPFYTVLHPEKAIEIPGHASALAIHVKAHSDWGRLVYVLHDAKGEKWISCGAKGEWNSDDIRNLSFFNFDGWRLLRVTLPSNAPYDKFRNASTQSWGCSGGDSIVDLPLTLEKIIIERRPYAMYVNTLEKTNPAPVELADLYAEYNAAGAENSTAIKHNNITMPSASSASQINPIEKLIQNATLPATEITGVMPPESAADGTRGHFHFKEQEGAVSYDIYVALLSNGAGAIQLGKNLKKSGALISGFQADKDFYAFIVYRDKQNRTSTPSKPFHFKMDNRFGMR